MKVEYKQNKLQRLGFSFERGGVHTARTMMLVELRALLSYVDKADAVKAEYLEAIQTANCLGKRSGKTRTLTFRHLADLYALDPGLLVFRASSGCAMWMGSHCWLRCALTRAIPFFEPPPPLSSVFKKGPPLPVRRWKSSSTLKNRSDSARPR